MKKFFLLLTLTIFFALFSFNSCFAVWRMRYSVEPNNIIVGQDISVYVLVYSDAHDDPEATITINSGIPGSVPDETTCRASSPSHLSNCSFQAIYRYNQAGEYNVVISLRGGGAGNTANVIVSVVNPPSRPTPPTSLSPITATSVPQLLETVARIIYWLGTALIVIFIVLGGLIIISSAGNPHGIQKGKNTIFYALIGFAIMNMVRGIIELVNSIAGLRQ